MMSGRTPVITKPPDVRDPKVFLLVFNRKFWIILPGDLTKDSDFQEGEFLVGRRRFPTTFVPLINNRFIITLASEYRYENRIDRWPDCEISVR
ncbi:hypothetical protein CEXT_807441 [Caerostris extrusa]|uniref:Ycf15 n=1 Tax=Caerostris extrusa TaxID=172846 RepID=A0AAV4SZT7_CAEEX|nr:hypothetical protein CEXT_807441 [Caerostris extrusa]